MKLLFSVLFTVTGTNVEAVYEPMFYDEMMGFRPNRSCHKAIRMLNEMIERKPTNYILDADIKGFFDHLDHEWIVKFVESRIKDPNITRLVRRMLKAGIMKDFQYEATESPCLLDPRKLVDLPDAPGKFYPFFGREVNNKCKKITDKKEEFFMKIDKVENRNMR